MQARKVERRNPIQFGKCLQQLLVIMDPFSLSSEVNNCNARQREKCTPVPLPGSVRKRQSTFSTQERLSSVRRGKRDSEVAPAAPDPSSSSLPLAPLLAEASREPAARQ